MIAMMASLQKSLYQCSTEDRERQFYSQSLEYLSILSGKVVKLDKWAITSFEVEFGCTSFSLMSTLLLTR
jgi:hypothetical protein